MKNIQKTGCLFALLLLCAQAGISQDYISRCGQMFDPAKYPADSFAVRTHMYALGNTRIDIQVLHPKISIGEDYAWLTQYGERGILNARFVGVLGTESDVVVIENEPLPGYFLVYTAWEFTGTLHLLDARGVWYEMPGSEMLYDTSQQILYSLVPQECGGCTIGKFNLKTNTIETKDWDGQGTAWEGMPEQSSLKNVFEHAASIRWVE